MADPEKKRFRPSYRSEDEINAQYDLDHAVVRGEAEDVLDILRRKLLQSQNKDFSDIRAEKYGVLEEFQDFSDIRNNKW